ncbi:3-deoxy-manno-octulosonate cytidylyltransferase (CMP-KDO synthetase) [Halanaerobium congolense]|uniref:3-deoxy-manno-octulosonate cytidylyltransferase n=1 Tax=Halanaerobium congolense TaxID=54121 RepID=A0A4R7E2Q4_9FIRM|nr:3-deoxy-manno-octulosonate cytidylyltransferase [Halanaerobium congolense]TDS28045.1 3-deoxy-manno-octulosonate cytidylyltransferase (CMP-KDO synthetase) [Halanaerobium congolense]SDH60467.1 3-deoxy-manno-octulosonate cytidylyltransferase (CMP-KDO synthetase) [Halanaerobium congolense]
MLVKLLLITNRGDIINITAIIPARYSSTRLPGKPLKDICGKTMLQRVYEQVKKVSLIDEVIVATDDKRIFDEVKKFNSNVIMTSKDHKTGTDRLAEVAAKIDTDIIVNVQGDEPLIKPSVIKFAIKPLLTDNSLKMSTLKHLISDEEEINNPNIVKVITDKSNNAIYFSRSRIPYARNNQKFNYYKHIGLYVYRSDFLLKFAKMKPTPFEIQESLEQLRVIENGYKIKVIETEYDSIGVDTEEDLNKVRNILGE